MKKALSLILCLALAVSLLAIPAFASDWTGGPTVSLSSTAVDADGGIVVTLELKGTDADYLGAVTLNLVYDTAKVEPDASKGSFKKSGATVGVDLPECISALSSKQVNTAKSGTVSGEASTMVAIVCAGDENETAVGASSKINYYFKTKAGATGMATFTLATDVAGNFKVTDITGEKNLVMPTAGSVTASAKITDEPASVKTAPTAKDDLVYTGNALTLVEGGVAENGTMVYRIGTSDDFTEKAEAIDAGRYEVYYKAKGATADLDSEVGGPIEVSIAQATKTVPDVAVNATAGAQTLSLAAQLGDASADAEIIDDAYQILSDVAISGTDLKYTVAADAPIGKQATIVVDAYGAKNYEDFDFNVIVTVIDKEAQTLSFAGDKTVEYGDTFTQEVTGAKTTVTYSSSNTAIATVDNTGKVTAVGVGEAEAEAVITATAAETEEYASATASYTVKVTPKAITVTPKDKTAYVGGKLPDLSNPDYTVSPAMIGDDTLTTIKLAYAKDGDYTIEPDTKTAGEYQIVVLEADAGANYTIEKGVGKLTIRYASSGDSGSGGTGTAYTDEIVATENGTVKIDKTSAKAGEDVTVTLKPDEGYQVARVIITDENGNKIEMDYKSATELIFKQPNGKVKIEVIYAPIGGTVDVSNVVPTPQTITINGVAYDVEAYNINGRNFIKLRDLAAMLRATPARFNVAYDAERNMVVITTGEAYDGTVGTGFTDKSETAVASPQSVQIDGRPVSLSGVNIGGYNFFSLRELAPFFGYGVDYNELANTAMLTSK